MSSILRIGRPNLGSLEINNTLINLFSNAYGDGYRGDDALNKKLDEANFALIHMTDEQISAGCVVDSGRITTIGTQVNPILTKPRLLRMTDFLKDIGKENGVEWISIGLEYHRMQEAAEKAGMYKLKLANVALELLESAGELDRYRLCAGGGDPVVIAKKGYNQNIWLWRDEN